MDPFDDQHAVLDACVVWKPAPDVSVDEDTPTWCARGATTSFSPPSGLHGSPHRQPFNRMLERRWRVVCSMFSCSSTSGPRQRRPFVIPSCRYRSTGLRYRTRRPYPHGPRESTSNRARALRNQLRRCATDCASRPMWRRRRVPAASKHQRGEPPACHSPRCSLDPAAGAASLRLRRSRCSILMRRRCRRASRSLWHRARHEGSAGCGRGLRASAPGVSLPVRIVARRRPRDRLVRSGDRSV
jgi:hypothetical protein